MNLKKNNGGTEGMVYIPTAIEDNKALVKPEKGENKGDISPFHFAVGNNWSFETMDFKKTHDGSEGVVYIPTGIGDNKVLLKPEKGEKKGETLFFYVAVITGEEVETMWTSLRNRYVTKKRKIRLVPTGSAPLPIWRYFKNMEFLDDFITVRKTEGNISKTNVWSTPLIEESTNETQQSSSSLDNDDSIMNQHEQSSQIDEEPKAGGSKEHKENIYTMKKNKKRKIEESTSVEKSISNALGAIGNILNTPEETEDILFGKSIGQSLALIQNRKTKARAKEEILEVIERYQ